MEEYIAIGLMSGTSMDSIDAAAVRVELAESKTEVRLLKGITYPIPDCIRSMTFELFEDGPGSLHKISLLNIRLGSLFAEAALRLLKEAGLKAEEVAVIGSHGQTMHHVSLDEECCGRRQRGAAGAFFGSNPVRGAGKKYSRPEYRRNRQCYLDPQR